MWTVCIYCQFEFDYLNYYFVLVERKNGKRNKKINYSLGYASLDMEVNWETNQLSANYLRGFSSD